MENYGWKSSLLLFYNAVKTVNIITARYDDVNFVETESVHFA